MLLATDSAAEVDSAADYCLSAIPSYAQGFGGQVFSPAESRAYKPKDLFANYIIQTRYVVAEKVTLKRLNPSAGG